MLRKLTVVFLFCLTFPIPALAENQAKFVGDLVFTDKNCEATGKCILKKDFGFEDGTGQGWQAEAGNETDGASIPKLLQNKFIGKPFDKDILKAAVIHDHYCDRTVHTWWKTHKVFYDALIASGVKKSRAKLMFTGVLIGGPKWIRVRKDARSCNVGEGCIQVGGKSVVEEILSRPTKNDDENAEKQFDEVAELIKQDEAISLDDILEMVMKKNPDDQFFQNSKKELLDFSTAAGVAE